MKNIINKIIAAAFAVCFCLICMANIAVPKSDYSENENRFLEKMPSLTLESLKNGDFMRNFEKYTSDQFILRDFFVSLKAKTERLLLKTENNGIYFADDNYLIEKPTEYNSEILDINTRALQRLKALKRYNVTLSVVPPAYEILKDKLPDNAYKPVMKEAEEYIDISLGDSGVYVCNPTELLSENKDKYIYYRTDHHQTALGGYLVYTALGKPLGYTPLTEAEFDISEVSNEFLGTTWSKSMINKKSADTIFVYTPKANPTFTVDFPYESKSMNSLYETEKLSTKDKYGYFLDGNHGLSVIKSSVENGKKLMVIKDSYAHNVVPFLANHYEKIYMVDLRYFNTDILEYLYENDITDILALYSLSGFMTDSNLAKVYSWCENSPFAKQPYGVVYETESVGNEYFDNAVFIGDSLTEGLKLYNSLRPQQFLSYIGMSLYGIGSKKFPDANGKPVYDVIDMIAASNADKIYIMLGTNDEISPKAQEYYISNYSNFIDNIRKYRPEAIIYLQSILPVTPEKELEGRFKNSYISLYNEALKALAKEKKCYYLDVRSVCADSNGNMTAGVSPDGIHLDVSHYQKWFDYIKKHAVDDSKFKKDSVSAVMPIASTVPVSEGGIAIAEDLKANVSFSDNLWAIDNSIGASLYGISAELLKAAVIYAGSGATAEEIAVFEYADSSAREIILEKINEHLFQKKNSFENYLPSEVVKLSYPYIKITDKYIILCVSDHNDTAEAVLKKYSN